MESHKLSFKLFAQDDSSLKGQELVNVFHNWIQQKKVPDHLLIDVADYQHVHHGPGTLLISFEANFAADNHDGRLGLLYVRKQPILDTTSFSQRLRRVVRPLLEAAARLEEELTLEGRFKFRTDEMLFRVYDRLLAPNNSETLAAVRPDLTTLISDLYGAAPVALEQNNDPQSLFEVLIKAPASPTLPKLISRL